MVMYSFFRALGSWTRSLDIASRFTGVSIQVLIVYTGYLIPPTKMHPWFKWLMWINPVQYGFEALMANEFYNLEIQCVPPYLVPDGPGSAPQYQSCLVQGSQPGQSSVSTLSPPIFPLSYWLCDHETRSKSLKPLYAHFNTPLVCSLKLHAKSGIIAGSWGGLHLDGV